MADLLEGAAWLKHGDQQFGPFQLHRHPRSGRVLIGCGDGNGNLRVGERGGLGEVICVPRQPSGPRSRVPIPSLTHAPATLKPLSPIAFAGANGGIGKWAQWDVSTGSGGGTQFRNFGNAEKEWCLGVENGDLFGTATEPAGFTLVPVASVEGASALSSVPEFVESVDFTKQQRLAFKLDGFVQLRGCVPLELVGEAIASINAALCTPGSVTQDGDGMVFCPGLGATKAIQNLLCRDHLSS